MRVGKGQEIRRLVNPETRNLHAGLSDFMQVARFRKKPDFISYCFIKN